MCAALLAEDGGGAALVDTRFGVRYLEGDVQRFLAFTAGPLRYDLLAMAPVSMRSRLRRACELALDERRSVRDEAARGDAGCSVTVVPISTQDETLLLVTFRQTADPRRPATLSPDSEAAAIRELERALEATQRNLAGTIRQLEDANERLRSSNEEVTAMNEELRAANAELESSGEELRIVNDELELKVEETARTSADLENLISATEIPILFLDLDLRIQRYTPGAGGLFHLIPSDVGRPLADIAPRCRDAALLADARAAAAAGPVPQKLIPALNGRWYLRRLRPYRLAEGRLAGVVLAFVDVTEQKALREEVLSISSLEQRRIGQELHDGTQQELTGLGLLAQTLAETLAGQGAARESELAAKLAAGIGDANRRVRDLSRGLVPVAIPAYELEAALTELARRTLERDRLSVVLDYSAAALIDNDSVATHLFRIAQEAVTNAVKHAEASELVIEFRAEKKALRLAIADDGKGLDESREYGGAGLRIMAHRSALLGGTLAVRARPGGGTIVTCVVPWGRDHAAETAVDSRAAKRPRLTSASRTPT